MLTFRIAAISTLYFFMGSLLTPAEDSRPASRIAVTAARSGMKPVKVYILAGQSNTVGHAASHTMCSLFNPDGSRDQQLCEMVFGRPANLTGARLQEMRELARRLNELTGGVGDPKITAMTDAALKAAAEKDAAAMKLVLDEYTKEIVAASTVSDRVRITAIADNNKKSGQLAVGYGASESKIGPEYGFGLSIARKVDGPILLIKTSWGGKSLNYDFRPPSLSDYRTTPEYLEARARSEAAMQRYEAAVSSFPQEQAKYREDLIAYELQVKSLDESAARKLRKPVAPAQPRKPAAFSMEDAGLYYRRMNEEVHRVLDNLQEYHPDYDPAAGFELSGFVWFQGYNDQFDEHFRANYKRNMVAFIRDIRLEYNVQHLPFVIGVLGTGQTREKVDENAVSAAQREAAAIPEFRNNVTAVESYTEYGLDALEVFNSGWQKNFYEWNLLGSDRPYHYLGSGKFFVRVGDAFASAMAGMTQPE